MLVKVESMSDPMKCSVGDCDYRAQEGRDVCQLHGKKNSNLLNVARYQARLDEQKNHKEIKTLNSELGVLRILLETKLNLCKDDTDLMVHQQGIADLALKINTLVLSIIRLEEVTSKTLTKQQIELYTTQLISIVSSHVSPDALALIAGELDSLLSKL